MIDGLEPYPAMKSSGVPWLGEVPAHWEVRKLKYVVSFSGGGTPSKAEASFWGGRIPWVSPKDMTCARIADSLDHITEEAVSASATSVVLPGALLMVVRSGILRRTIPVAINAVEVALNQDMKALRPRAGVVASDYLRAFVQGNEGALIQEWTKQGATVESIEHEFLANSLVPLPPLPEQAAIVRFLDYADRRIRRYIRAKQKLIKLLEEQKQAIIHRAVTRGLDPSVRLKPSGVEWLGDVPEHWEVLKLARVIADGPRNGTSPPIDENGTIESFSISAIRDGRVDVRDSDKKYISGDKTALEAAYRLLRDDVLLVRGNGNVRLVGKAGVVVHDMPGRVYPDLLMRLRLTPRCMPQFLVALLTCPTGRDQVETAARTAVGTFKINNQQVRQLCFALPPAAEQEGILRWLDHEISTLRAASSHAAEEILLFREYRTRLIADVVTGKLDVREAAARLPDEAEAPEFRDEIEAEGDTDEAFADDPDAVPEKAEA